MRPPFDADVAPAARRTRRPGRGRRLLSRRLTGWWTLAAVLHLAGLLLVLRAPVPHKDAPKVPARPSQRELGRALAEARRARADAPKRKVPPPEQPRGPIVELAPGESTPPPKDARRLAERDSRVDKESSARPGQRAERPVAPAPAPARAPVAPAPAPAAQAPAATPAPKDQAKKAEPKTSAGPRRPLSKDGRRAPKAESPTAAAAPSRPTEAGSKAQPLGPRPPRAS